MVWLIGLTIKIPLAIAHRRDKIELLEVFSVPTDDCIYVKEQETTSVFPTSSDFINSFSTNQASDRQIHDSFGLCRLFIKKDTNF